MLRSVRLSEEDERQFLEAKVSLIELVRAGLNQYLNKPILQPIKTKEQAQKAIEQIQEETPEDRKVNVYGCGCAKQPGKILCIQHKRY